MKIITDVKDAQFLLEATELVFDLETNTAAPHKDWGANFGLSYVTDMTWISFYTKGFPVVALKMRGIPDDEYAMKSKFIHDVLSRDNIRIIAHNANFDLRLAGGHHGFTVAPHSYVWDTMTMANLLLMGARQNKIFGLEALLSEYNLISWQKDLDVEDDAVFTSEAEFVSAMKKNRAILHLLDTEQSKRVLTYVSLDAITTWRLYELQKHIVATQGSPNILPKIRWTGLSELGRDWDFEMTIWKSKNKHVFSSTKNWSNLEELVLWEQRISRWSANAAIRGVKFNKEWSQQHMQILSEEYGEGLQAVEAHYKNFLSNDEMKIVSDLVYYEYLYESTKNGQRVYQRERFPLLREAADTPPFYSDCAILNSDSNVDEITFWASQNDEYYLHPFQHNVPHYRITNEDTSTSIQLMLYKPSLEMWFEQKFADRQYPKFLAKIAASWYNHALMERSEEVFDKTVNKNKFKPFYLFCVANAPLPCNEDFVEASYLLSGDLKTFAEDGGEADFLSMAMENDKFSMGDDALHFYHKALWERSGEDVEYKNYKHPVLHPFIDALTHKAKFNRIREFWRHAERDGRIHSLITRKTGTGRMSSSQMNLQNIDMDVYRGYLMADDEDHVLIGVDVSNAENYFAAMTFGDSELARACVYGDFHETMARAYWGDALIDELKRTDYEGAFKKTRSRGKAVTFGGAYGAGFRKIARMVGCTQEEARELLANRDMRFPDYARGKNLATQRAEACYNDGFRPAFTTLWTGRRVSVPYIAFMKKTLHPDGTITEKWVEGLTGYKAINYLQQGGVGELILRAQVLAEEEFEKRGWVNCHIPLQVHDEIIAHVHKDVALEAAHVIAKVIFDVVPEQYRKRTTPNVRFLANLGAENAKKWGYNPLVEYPVDKTKFANAWGVWDMPEGETATPLWIEDESDGVQEQYDELAKPAVVVEELDKWVQLQKLVQRVDANLAILKQHFEPVMLNVNGEQRGPFTFNAKMNLLQHLHHNGLDPSALYWKMFEDLDKVVNVAEEMQNWLEANNPE